MSGDLDAFKKDFSTRTNNSGSVETDSFDLALRVEEKKFL
jgi:hypothetical protein